MTFYPMSGLDLALSIIFPRRLLWRRRILRDLNATIKTKVMAQPRTNNVFGKKSSVLYTCTIQLNQPSRNAARLRHHGTTSQQSAKTLLGVYSVLLIHQNLGGRVYVLNAQGPSKTTNFVVRLSLRLAQSSVAVLQHSSMRLRHAGSSRKPPSSM